MEDHPMFTGEVKGILHGQPSPARGDIWERKPRRSSAGGFFRQLKETMHEAVWEAVDAITPGHRCQRPEARLSKPQSQVSSKEQRKALHDFRKLQPPTFLGTGGPK
ncbi:hypothetical protein Droror1_Dr00018030, partial [Drosera rotundifolia]